MYLSKIRKRLIKASIVIIIIFSFFFFHYYNKTKLYYSTICTCASNSYNSLFQKNIGIDTQNLDSDELHPPHSDMVHFVVYGDLCTSAKVASCQQSEKGIIVDRKRYSIVLSLHKNNFIVNKQVTVIHNEFYSIFDVDTSNYVYYIHYLPLVQKFYVLPSKGYIILDDVLNDINM
jgi:hypothetical protein